MRRLNLGIVAHVDAGKTTLTERLLFAAGVIDEIGSVDDGTTQTDSLALERQRGITIRSAVVSFAVGDVMVNLIDTPGHPDFIAEVERALSVLDGAVLVISAVEGVQPQTRILMRALRRLRVPTVLFVNKIDRRGAGYERVLETIARRLAVATAPMGAVEDLGTPAARFRPWAPETFRANLTDVLAGRNDALLATYVEDESRVTYGRLREELAAQARRAQVHPVFFGSAITGAGVEPLMAGLVDLLPAAAGDAAGPVSGRIFKIERGPAGEKVAYVRMFSGTVRARDRLRLGRDRDGRTADGRTADGRTADDKGAGRGGGGGKGAGRRGAGLKGAEGKVTAIGVYDRGPVTRCDRVSAGQIAQLWGLGEAQVGDTIGGAAGSAAGGAAGGAVGGAVGGAAGGAAGGGHGSAEGLVRFDPPTLTTVVVPRDRDAAAALRLALDQLAEQDPLIDVRQDDARHEVSLSLYGEVQKQVIGSTLASEYGIEVDFRATTTICVERPAGTGTAVEYLNAAGNPFHATMGLRVDPAPAGSGVEFRLRVDTQCVPLFIYKNRGEFAGAMERYVRRALREGLAGWEVTDCVVTMTSCEYSLADGPPARRGPMPTAADFRDLTPIVVSNALARAGTVVCEPYVRARLEIPAATLGSVLAALADLGGSPREQSLTGELATIQAMLPAVRVSDLQRRLPVLTGGEGVMESGFGGYRPVTGVPPTRRRAGVDPLDRAEYLASLGRQGIRKAGDVCRPDLGQWGHNG